MFWRPVPRGASATAAPTAALKSATTPVQIANDSWRADQILRNLCEEYEKKHAEQEEVKKQRDELAGGTTQLFLPAVGPSTNYDLLDVCAQLKKICSDLIPQVAASQETEGKAEEKKSEAKEVEKVVAAPEEIPKFRESARRIDEAIRHLNDHVKTLEKTSPFLQLVLQPFIQESSLYYHRLSEPLKDALKGMLQPQASLRVIDPRAIAQRLISRERVVITACAAIRKFPFIAFDEEKAKVHATLFANALVHALKEDPNRDLWIHRCDAAVAIAPRLEDKEKITLAQQLFAVTLLSDQKEAKSIAKKTREINLSSEQTEIIGDTCEVFGPHLTLQTRCETMMGFLKYAPKLSRGLQVLASQQQDDKSKTVLSNMVREKMTRSMAPMFGSSYFYDRGQHLAHIIGGLDDDLQMRIVVELASDFLDLEKPKECPLSRAVVDNIQSAIKNLSPAANFKLQNKFLEWHWKQNRKMKSNDVDDLLLACRLSLISGCALTADKKSEILIKLNRKSRDWILYFEDSKRNAAVEIISIIWDQPFEGAAHDDLIEILKILLQENADIENIIAERLTWLSPQDRFKLVSSGPPKSMMSKAEPILCELVAGLPLPRTERGQWARALLPAGTLFLCGLNDDRLRALKTGNEFYSLPSDPYLSDYFAIARKLGLPLCVEEPEDFSNGEVKESGDVAASVASESKDISAKKNPRRNMLFAMEPHFAKTKNFSLFIPLIRVYKSRLSATNPEEAALIAKIDRHLVKFLVDLAPEFDNPVDTLMVYHFNYDSPRTIFKYVVDMVSAFLLDDKPLFLEWLEFCPKEFTHDYWRALRRIMDDLYKIMSAQEKRSFVQEVLTKTKGMQNISAKSQIVAAVAPFTLETEKENLLQELLSNPFQLSNGSEDTTHYLRTACFEILHSSEDVNLSNLFYRLLNNLLADPLIKYPSKVEWGPLFIHDWLAKNGDEEGYHLGLRELLTKTANLLPGPTNIAIDYLGASAYRPGRM